MFLVVGLGNPGKEYENNRHNVGFRVIQSLADVMGIVLNSVECNAILGKGERSGDNILLAQPLTYVNASGESVKYLVSKYEVSLEHIIIIHDDLDLPVGDVRVKIQGGSGGHKGLDSIIRYLGSDEFGRVRIGIGRPPGRKDPADFVLSDFTRKEEEEITFAVKEGEDAVLNIIKEGFQAAMNRYNMAKEEK